MEGDPRRSAFEPLRLLGRVIFGTFVQISRKLTSVPTIVIPDGVLGRAAYRRGNKMKKSTKGAVAAAAAGVLLLGGAGSLAFWSDAVTVGGDTISSGHLSLDDTTGTTDDCADADWLLDGGSVFDTASGLLVPGDTLTKICTFDVSALGEHLSANLAATGGTSTGGLASQVSTAAAFTVAGATASSIDESNDGDEVSAKITLTFNGVTATNVSQDESLVLSAYTVTATQAHS
jgi:alternate signal-mediated exported protein